VTKFKLGYRPELDGFRGVAILVVMLYHLQGFPLANGGHIGVDLFFVLSGFLITSLLLSEWETHQRIDLKAFYARRALRLLPALYTMVAVSLLFGLVFNGTRLVADDSADLRSLPSAALASVTYCSNWLLALQINYLGPLIHTWTLAMEVQFYVVWSLVLILLLRVRVSLQAIEIGLLVSIVAVGIWRFVLWQEVDGFRAQYGPDARADALLVGCLVAVLAHDGRLEGLLKGICGATPVCSVIFLVIAGSALSVRSAPVFLGAASLIDIAAAVCLAYLVAARKGLVHKALSTKPAVTVGRWSYGLYIWHLPVYYLVDGVSPAGWMVEFAVSFLIAAASFVLVEQPALRLNSRFLLQTRPDSRVRLAS
jgi:peptidoglycan/LPS O-acetylase OafA/YrhL